jgi:serine/threonine protein phosphatase PrpC
VFLASEIVQPTSMHLRESAPPGMSLSVATCTDVGRKRRKNEDKCLVLVLDEQKDFDGQMAATFKLGPLGLVLAIADGMGGHQSGEVASALCTLALTKELLDRATEGKLPGENPQMLLAETVETANEAIYTVAGQKPEYRGMGTTLTVAWLMDTSVELAQVGDSRAYLFHQGELIPLTEDQTVGHLLDFQQSTVQVSNHMRDMLTQAVGAQPSVSVVVSRTSLQPGDSLMLCCDGLYKVVEEAEIKEILALPVSAQAKVEGLVERANDHGGPDNITVILAEVLAQRQ